MSKNYFFLLFFIFILMTIYYVHSTKKKAEDNINQYKQIINDLEKSNNKKDDKNISVIQEVPRVVQQLPITKLLEYRDRSVLYDPIVAPERRVDYNQYPFPIINRINIPTRGYPDNYQLLGLVSRDGDEKILQLFGRATFPGSNQYEYYVTTETNGFANKIPIETRGKKEIEDGQSVTVPIFDKSKGDFKVKLYNYDAPRYNPHIL